MHKQILRRAAVIERAGLSSSQINRLEKEGRFPHRIQITKHAVGWSAEAVDAWIQERLNGIAA